MALPVRGGGGVKACPDGLEHFFCIFVLGGGGIKTLAKMVCALFI